MKCGDAALCAPGLFRIQIKICLREKRFNSFSTSTVDRNADTCREPRFFVVLNHNFTDAVCDVMRLGFVRLWQHQSELIATIARRGIDGPAMNTQDRRQPTKGAAAH